MARRASAGCAFAWPTCWRCWRRGIGEDEILADFPDLEREDIRASLAYAAAQLGHPVIVTA
jgi:uncharacterized protein (DUF433 family)